MAGLVTWWAKRGRGVGLPATERKRTRGVGTRGGKKKDNGQKRKKANRGVGVIIGLVAETRQVLEKVALIGEEEGYQGST